MTHLLIFTIGPVQSFIAAARKTQDLFAGSAILSHLVYCALERLEKKINESGGTIEKVFPQVVSADKDSATNPNRFSVIIKNFNGTAKDLKKLIDKIKQDVIEVDFTAEALPGILESTSGAVSGIAKKQLEAFPEIFWGALPLEKQELYPTVSTKLESYIGGIKNFRNLVQLEETGRKCNVDGVHNVVVYRRLSEKINGISQDETDEKLNRKLNLPLSDLKILNSDQEPIWTISPGEGLSAISYYKRLFLGNHPHVFPSTARVALMHVLENQAIQVWGEFIALDNLIGSNNANFCHSDDQMFYEENITEQNFRKKGVFSMGTDLRAKVNDVKAKWTALSKKMKDEKIPDFQLSTKYYALLMFDGDKMGEWLSGEHLTDKSTLLEFQKTLSLKLHDFAKAAKEYLNKDGKCRGKTVFAAGEDFMALININTLLEVLKELRSKFDLMVNKTLKNESISFSVKDQSNLTFSAGVAIAHYKQPLPTVLQEAREAEKKAKMKVKESASGATEVGGNRVCFTVMRHSGGITSAILPFEHLDSFEAVIAEIKNENNDKFSNAFIHQLIGEMRIWKKDINPRNIFDEEAKRLIERASNHTIQSLQTTKELFKSKKAAEVKKITGFLDLISHKNGSEILLKKDLDNTFAILRIADFIQRTQKGETQ